MHGHEGKEQMRLSRREFAKQTLLAGGSLALGCSTHTNSTGTPAPTGGTTTPTLPNPSASGIDHIVVVTMENRSFDHLLGWLPTAAGKQAGLSYPDATGVLHPTYALSGDFTGCPKNGPDHTYTGSRQEYNGGA